MNYYPKEYIKKEADKGFTTRKNNCKIGLPELADKYQVMGIPSLLIFKNGEKTGHLHSANAKTPEEVNEFLAEHIS